MSDLMSDPDFAVTPQRLMAMRRALTRLQVPARRATSLAFLTATEIARLGDYAGQQTYRTATPQIEHRGNSVFQDFDVCFPAPREGAFAQLATLLETTLQQAGALMTSPPLPLPLPLPPDIVLNDFAIQRYPAGSRGIGIHRDGRRYRGIVVIVTLAGTSRLFTCTDRQGAGIRRIDDRPGRIVLLSAEGFAEREGEQARPLHGVDRIGSGRLSLGLRYLPADAA
jgi:hypothetical protein